MITLTPQQNEVFEHFQRFMESDASVFILRGYAGTGKTTMLKQMAEYVRAHYTPPVLMAPTGRAAKVLAEKTDFGATTIHRAIYENKLTAAKEEEDIAETKLHLLFQVRRHTERVIAIVDEASMVSAHKVEHSLFKFGSDVLLQDLLTFAQPHSAKGKLVFVGDPAQLPPVGAPRSEALDRGYFEAKGLKVYEAELTEVLRQGEGSLILRNAMMLRSLLSQEKRTQRIFEERQGDVEQLLPEVLFQHYFDCLQQLGADKTTLICYTNGQAARYNEDVRTRLYGKDAPLREGDRLLVMQNNYLLNRMNGELVTVQAVGARSIESAPVWVEVGGERKREIITFHFIAVQVLDVSGRLVWCQLLENLLTSSEPSLSHAEQNALYINFCMRHPGLKPESVEFANALLQDPYYNALRAKYGYVVTGHKSQGGEWDTVFVDYSGRGGLDDDSLRWAYTVTTRAHRQLYYANLPRVTAFSSFRILPIQRCKHMPVEYRSLSEVVASPFHDTAAEAFLKAKCHAVMMQLEGTPYSIHHIESKPYREIYHIQTPKGVARYDLTYKGTGLFAATVAKQADEYTADLLPLLNNEPVAKSSFCYTPSTASHAQLYTTLRQLCEQQGVVMSNVVEHPEDYSVNYYLHTSNTHSYLKIYINKGGFITSVQPMSLVGAEDEQLGQLIDTIRQTMC